MEYPELPAICWTDDVFVIGLTGAIGSGKTAAADAFRENGIAILNADLVAKEVLHSTSMRQQLINTLGPDILDDRGEISRLRIAQIVFRNSNLREQLNGLIHPEVHRRFEEFRTSLNRGDIMVYDVPLLFEVGMDDIFDMTIVISAPYELRKKRVIKREGWSEEHFDSRESSQIPLSEKERRADLVIRNDKSIRELTEAIRNVILHIKAGRNME